MLLLPQVVLLLLNALLINSSPTFEKQQKDTHHPNINAPPPPPPPPGDNTGPTVTLQNGATLTGTDEGPVNGYNLARFAGIPYAKAPTGQLRLALPQATTLHGNINAQQFGSACPQATVNGVDLGEQSEDCLTLNVYIPDPVQYPPASSSFPVFVWFHNSPTGFFEGGSGKLFDGSALVASGQLRGSPYIFVSFNYRVGPLGFPVGQEASSAKILNLGLHDQLLALEWVKENIKSFGGDSTKVTVAGQSSGSISISNHLLNPQFSLARAAILQSGSAASANVFEPTTNEEDWTHFAQAAGCNQKGQTLRCLREKSSKTVTNAASRAIKEAKGISPFSPVIDGPNGIIPNHPHTLISQGHFAKLPILTGTTQDEGTKFIPDSVKSDSSVKQFFYEAIQPYGSVSATQKRTVDELAELYNVHNQSLLSPFGQSTDGVNTQHKRASAIFGDTQFQALRRSWAQAVAKAGAPIYVYEFTEPQAQQGEDLGVYHGSEVPYLFSADTSNLPASVTPAGSTQATDPGKMQALLLDYWTAFTINNNPLSGDDITASWDAYTLDAPVILNLTSLPFSDAPEFSDTYRSKQIDFVNNVFTAQELDH